MKKSKVPEEKKTYFCPRDGTIGPDQVKKVGDQIQCKLCQSKIYD